MIKDNTEKRKKAQAQSERARYIEHIHRVDNDLTIILLITMVFYAVTVFQRANIENFILSQNISAGIRLLVSAAMQFGMAGLGALIVVIFRKETPAQYGFRLQGLPAAVLGTIACFVPYIIEKFISGQFTGYHPFTVPVTADVLSAGVPLSVIGMIVIALVWGVFEAVFYLVLSRKVDQRFPDDNAMISYGALFCVILCVLFHPVNFASIWGVFELIAIAAAVYGMLIVKKMTGNAWGCILAFCLIWNAF